MDRNLFKQGSFDGSADEAQTPLWFWNDRLEKKELIRQLSLMTDKGVVCNAPHARSGFIGEYLDQEWMENIRLTLDYKREHKEKMWLYDEFNWPAGMAGGRVTIHEPYREKFLFFEKHYVPAGKRLHLKISPLAYWAESENAITMEKAQQKAENIFCFDAQTMEMLDVMQFQPVDKENILFLLSDTDFELLRDRDTIVYEAKISTEPFRGEGRYDPDYLNPDTADYFIDVTLEAYYREFKDDFGTVITADFNDETRFAHAFPWTERLTEEFYKRYGYRLEEHLTNLVIPGEDEGRTRIHYYNLLADLYRENYHARLNRWCTSHGIDYCPHLLGEETMAAQTRFGGDLLRQVREMKRPGADHLGKGIGSLNLKFISSAAEVYGRKGMFCETFAAAGWEMTFDEYVRMISWLYSQGVKTVVNHGFFYSTEGFRHDDWPPSQFFQWQHWDRMDEGSRYCRRLYAMTKDCRRETDVLIYHPIESFWLDYMADQNFLHGYHLGPVIRGDRASFIDHAEQVLLNRLQEENRDFAVFPSDAAGLFEVSEGKLVQKETGQAYQAFVLPFCDVLPLKMAVLLDAFTAAGGHLAVMETVPRIGMSPSEDDEVRHLMERILSRDSVVRIGDSAAEPLISWLDTVCPKRLNIIEGLSGLKKTQLSYPDYVIDPYIHSGEDMEGIFWCCFKDHEETRYMMVNFTKEPQCITVETKERMSVWDAMSGEVYDPEITKDGHVKFMLPVGTAVFLVMK